MLAYVPLTVSLLVADVPGKSRGVGREIHFTLSVEGM